MKARYISQANPSVRTDIRINQNGYRGPDWDLMHAYKIAFLGDSFTAAFEVPYKKTFVAGVEADLKSRGEDVACINLTIDGTGTGMQLIQFERVALSLKPDVALLQVFVGNDFVDNSQELNWKRYYPYWTQVDNELQLLEPEIGIPVFMKLARYSYGLVYMYNQYRKLRIKSVNAAVHMECPELYDETPPPAWERSYALTMALLNRFVAKAKENGIRPIVLIVPKAEQLDAAAFPQGYNPRRPQDSILKAMSGKALCIDLLPLLQEETARREGPYWWNIPHDGHFSEEGHAFVKSVLLKYLGREKSDS